MGGGRQNVGQQGPQRMVIVDAIGNLSKFPGEKTESADNYFDANDDYLKMQQINVVDATCSTNHNQIWLFIIWKSQKVFYQGKDGRSHATVADWNTLKEQFKQQTQPSR